MASNVRIKSYASGLPLSDLKPRNIFLLALAVRWIYALLIFAFMGAAGLKGTDSILYLQRAHTFAATIASGSLHGLGWLGPVNFEMPLFQWLIGLCALAFGPLTPIGYVLVQGLIDAATCLIVYALALSLDRRFAALAGLAAALNPTQIVLCGLVYTDTPFLFFVALSLWTVLRWLQRPAFGTAIAAGFALGGAILMRAVAAPFAPVLILIMLIIAAIRRQFSRRLAAQIATMTIAIALCVSPVIWRNGSQFGAWTITAQGGMHLALWVVPLVKEAQDGTPWATTYDKMQQRTKAQFPTPPTNEFEQARQYRIVGLEALSELKPFSIVDAWARGIAINLLAPAITLSPVLSQLPRTGFYETKGSSFLGKVFNFVTQSSSRLYASALLLGSVGLLIMRIIQIVGFIELMRDRRHWPALAIFICWIGFILMASGPIASPKYRLPIECVLSTLTGAGLYRLGAKRRRTPLAAEELSTRPAGIG